ncbi:MAG: hypothetical protein MJE66_05235 [Proteobacteria bacterium]|nr:hypothetical protein [Pseudomonadota bacterium]
MIEFIYSQFGLVGVGVAFVVLVVGAILITTRRSLLALPETERWATVCGEEARA